METFTWLNPDGSTQQITKHVFGKDCTGETIIEGDTLRIFPRGDHRVKVGNFRHNQSVTHPCYIMDTYDVGCSGGYRRTAGRNTLDWSSSLMVVEDTPMTLLRWLRAKKCQLINHDLRNYCSSKSNKVERYIKAKWLTKYPSESKSWYFFFLVAGFFSSVSTGLLLSDKNSFKRIFESYWTRFKTGFFKSKATV